MSGLESQIVTAYDEGLTAQQIAEQLDLAEESVKLVLTRRSGKYRKAVKAEIEEITESEKQEMFEVIKNIARTQQYDNPGVALKAAIMLVDEKKGRRKLPDKANSQVNIIMFNEELTKARKRLLEMKKSALALTQPEPMTVDV